MVSEEKEFSSSRRTSCLIELSNPILHLFDQSLFNDYL